MASEEERGIRMKCVGLLAVGYSDLHLHRDFLQRQVRYSHHTMTSTLITLYDVMITSSRIQVETPGEYGSLEEYFRHYRSPQQVAVSPRSFSEPGLLGPNDLPTLTVSYNPECPKLI